MSPILANAIEKGSTHNPGRFAVDLQPDRTTLWVTPYGGPACRAETQQGGDGIPLAGRVCSNCPGLPRTRQRLECGAFTAALVRAPSSCASSRCSKSVFRQLNSFRTPRSAFRT